MIKEKSRVKPAVAFILERAKEERFSVGMVRLTKLLYLLDVEYFRAKREIYTGLDWIFYWYGPYAPRLEAILSNLGIDIEERDLGEKTFKEIAPGFEERWAEGLDVTARSILDELWREWGLETLSKLLDYVYFETEPMEAPIRGEKLDFGKVSPRQVPATLRWTAEEKTKLHEIGQSIKNKLARISVPQKPAYPPETSEILKIWDEEELANLGALKGKATIDFSAFKEKDSNGPSRG
ncbi:hypothetical protein HKBW3S43_00532 [Candidatus Hakubella thermalkaliphila]|uniref:Antitoxin SocA-like Panacea domain-containing protein n=2 Tax=Candidatus Hakubella thermalkaliphila TaxID=2754717 RepID=A0A6V8NWE2_9ACTN|nr:type II toxin-antitoxin system antitoxin SocA domain-containing protein [Candidatus Hakubella thermalkaliphila]GFP21824.1 hypothetical protein HKBW3S06_01051 [Candidatus Hakubella thermalkaliphila]GFP24568.1 hypothetical protein HKBW3S25_00006 [Candidatus Hakubella thermalkaliphila]GFP27416.1 hypothetical protein HKBW3S33_00829 [Candidatus Hakubella thermalkaliphila]GFP34740.1 hypothetical protein HKBW3S43_00532 [Candidatus Hakubella thermalkaliphila]GFP42540.1 hypothetical protein HKBW3C_0